MPDVATVENHERGEPRAGHGRRCRRLRRTAGLLALASLIAVSQLRPARAVEDDAAAAAQARRSQAEHFRRPSPSPWASGQLSQDRIELARNLLRQAAVALGIEVPRVEEGARR